MQSSLFWFTPVSSVLALGVAAYFYSRMKAAPEGTAKMAEIASHVRAGAMAYLRQQYKVVGIFFLVLTLIFAWLAYGMNLQNHWVPFAFLTGGFFSGPLSLLDTAGLKGAKNTSRAAPLAPSHALNGAAPRQSFPTTHWGRGHPGVA